MKRSTYRPLTEEEANRVADYAKRHGRTWKAKLRDAWMSGGNEEGTSGILRSLRNTHGPSWLQSYRPGCSGPPYDGRDPSELVEGVLGLLEDAGVPTETNDQIVKLIEIWEAAKFAEEDARIQLWPEDEQTTTERDDA